MTMGMTEAAAILKEKYPFSQVAELGLKTNKFLGMVKKDTSAGGDQQKLPMSVANLQASAATFSTAQTLSSSLSSLKRAFEITTVAGHYTIARMSGKVLAATKTNADAFLRAFDSEIRSAFATENRRAEIALARDGQGWLGRVASESSTALTLTDGSNGAGHRFEANMELVASSSLSGALRTGSATVTGINRQTGVLTSDSGWTSQITGLVANDYLFPSGDYVSASDVLLVRGLDAWLPETAPTSGDSFFGVDRSIDVDRLAGVRYDADAAGDTIEEALINAQSEGAANGAVPDVAFLPFKRYRQLLSALGSKREYSERIDVPARLTDNSDGTERFSAHVSYRGIVIEGDEGPLRVFSHPLLDYNVGFCLTLDTWTLFSTGMYPRVLDDDGSQMLRISNDDGYEIRIGGYPQLATNNPGANVRIILG
jgi:hypothetical protein